MKKLFIIINCFASVPFIITSCNNKNKGDCKKLIVKTWQIQNIEFNKEKYRQSVDFIDESRMNNEIERSKNEKSIIGFTSEGAILDNNSTKVGNYKLTLDCSKLIMSHDWGRYGQKFDTSLVNELTNEKLILERGNGITLICKPLN